MTLPDDVRTAIMEGRRRFAEDLAALASAGLPARDEFTATALRLGRNHGPALLFDWWYGRRLTREDLAAVIGDVWTDAEWPAASLTVANWVELFRTAGFVSDENQPKPTEPLRIWRGTTWGRRRGMSWTTERDRAKWFANRWERDDRHHALVFETVVEPAVVLALLTGGRSESEVVVDPRLLPAIRRPGAEQAASSP